MGTAGAASGFTDLISLLGNSGRISSLGSTTETLSGRGFLGPVLPLGSQGNMIFTWNHPIRPISCTPNRVPWFPTLLASTRRVSWLCLRNRCRDHPNGSSNRRRISWIWLSDLAVCQKRPLRILTKKNHVSDVQMFWFFLPLAPHSMMYLKTP